MQRCTALSTDLVEHEVTTFKRRLERALEFLRQNIPDEKVDEFYAFVDSLMESVKSGEKINMGDVVADLINPKKFALQQEVVEEFLTYLVGDEPGAESIVAGTIEYAKRVIWKRAEREK